MNQSMAEQYCGYVAIVGATNAGKSTLVNALVGTKVSIVSPKVQTTRFRVLGILIEDQSQMILVDTPGIFQPRRRLDRAMITAAWDGAWDADLICVLVDAHKGYDEHSKAIVARLKKAQRRAILVLNKVDIVRHKERLLALISEITAEGIFDETFMITALKEEGLLELQQAFIKKLPQGPWLFPEDQISDLPQRLLAAEITREKAFNRLHAELPYALMVESELWQEQEDGSARINQVIYVLRESQKPIVVGKGGRTIRAIGTEARLELESLLERPIHLFLRVKVKENWTESRESFSEIGLDFNQ